MRAKTSRQLCSFSRYRRRSCRLNSLCSTSSPTAAPPRKDHITSLPELAATRTKPVPISLRCVHSFRKDIRGEGCREGSGTAGQAQADAAAALAREKAAFLASPVGQATTAYEQNQGFFEIQLVVGSSQRDNKLWGDPAPGRLQVQTHAGTLSAIEVIGWKLEHAGYIFMITGESSRDRIMATGERTTVSGQTVGTYLFRRVDIVSE
jgi:hypothetical protein